MDHSPYLDRKVRSFAEYKAFRSYPETRLEEVHNCIERAEMELRKIAAEYGDERAALAQKAVTYLGYWCEDHLKPLQEEMNDARDEGREPSFTERWNNGT